MNVGFLDSPTFTWVVLPLLIFSARIVDVSLQTLRVIFINRGLRLVAPLLGFFEVLIWLLAIGQIMRHLDNFACYLAYGAGFATGTYVGMWIEGKLSLGMVILRVITRVAADALVAELRREEHGVTSIDAAGMAGPVKVLFTVLRRQDLPAVLATVRRYNPNAFYSVEDVRFASEGTFPFRGAGWPGRRLARGERKGK
ncbi:MAG: DUF2179 domain-containing protein [Proteobacteria bacterium]|nr:DUF2179 domain-containing protein [Pseudomonadota bacterium]